MSFLPVSLPHRRTSLLLESPDISTGHWKIYFLKNFMAALTSLHRLYSVYSAQHLGKSLVVMVTRLPCLKEMDLGQ